MNIQRKYSLPNCTLLLEGLSDASRAAHFQEMRPELSILVNAECYLSSYNQPLVGGREFFESLVRAVSGYAQEFLSNVPNPQAHNQDSELVELQKIDINRHRLIVHSEDEAQGFNSNPNPNNNNEPIQIDLNTVQLFDLVEAVDQFFADTQTLPELSLELQPVTRKNSAANQAVLKQAVPATIGVSSLAVAALTLSLIPSPQLRTPESNTQNPTSSTTPNVTPSATPAAAETTAPAAAITPTTSANATSTPIAAVTPTPSSEITPTPIAAVTPTPTPTTTPEVKDLEKLLTTVPEITDPSKLRALNRQLYNQINPAWANRSELSEDVVYRVGVAADGAIIGYKAVNQKANEEIQKTPLPNLLYNPATRGAIQNEPIAQYRVVLTKTGVLEVSPWRGYAKTPEVVGAKITDTKTVNNLSQKLYGTVRQSWGGTPTFERYLKYRVAVNKDGAIADYEPLNQVAYDYARETPLPQLLQQAQGSNLVAPNTKEPLAHFQLIFQPSGKLEITPWRGY